MKRREIVVINGTVSSPEEAKISVFDRGFLFGDAVYEVTRSYGRVLFQLEAHVERLFASASRLRMDLKKSQKEVCSELYRYVDMTDQDNVYVRVQVSRGQGPIGMDPGLVAEPNWVVYVRPLAPHKPTLYTQGCAVALSGVQRNDKRALDPNIKSGNYLNNVLAFTDGQERFGKYATQLSLQMSDLQEVLMLDSDGRINEGCTSNIFIVKNGRLLTPPDSSDLLKGITRRIILDLAASAQIELEMRPLDPVELQSADEAFLSSATRELMPVRSVEAHLLKNSPGPITSLLLKKYREYIAEYCRVATSGRN
jgi:branched-chain amino acid aminotransferase